MTDRVIRLADLTELVGSELAVTEWITVDQMQVNIFGEVTRWNKWMHADPKRATRESPFSGTLMHGFNTGEIIRTLTINPTRRYHGTGRPQGGPKGPRKIKRSGP